MRHVIIAGAILLLAGCGPDGENGDISPITPAPPLPFSVSGIVFDTVFQPVDQARIEALDGPQAGAVTLSDAHGRFSFGDRRFTHDTIRASKDGHQSTEQRISRFPANNLSFQLAASTPNIDLAGSYLVTITADAACTGLPANATSRTYSTTVTRQFSDTNYIGRLSGATFVPSASDFSRYDSFYANVFGTLVRFYLENVDEAYGIVEQLAPDAFVAFYGTADATVEAGTSSVEVPLSGSFTYCPGPRTADTTFFVCSITPITCTSTNHRLTLTRTGSP